MCPNQRDHLLASVMAHHHHYAGPPYKGQYLWLHIWVLDTWTSVNCGYRNRSTYLIILDKVTMLCCRGDFSTYIFMQSDIKKLPFYEGAHLSLVTPRLISTLTQLSLRSSNL